MDISSRRSRQSYRGLLLLDVLFHEIQRSAADAAGEIAAVPERRFPQIPFLYVRVIPAQHPAGLALEVVDDHRDRPLRRIPDQQISNGLYANLRAASRPALLPARKKQNLLENTLEILLTN